MASGSNLTLFHCCLREITMCQLLAMSCRQPANINFSFEGFCARGGLTDEHKDGWGIAFYRNDNVDVFLDHEPAASSALAEQVKSRDIKAKTIIAHIRKATVGDVKLANCHPFKRDLWGKTWLFCHNGDLKNFSPALDGHYLPDGDTDSELAFCYILQELQKHFPQGEPDEEALFSLLNDLAKAIESFGTFNFIVSNGTLLFTYCSTLLSYVVRQYPFTSVTLVDKSLTLDLSAHNNSADKMVVVATKPLTINESWEVYAKGEAKMFHEGELVYQSRAA